SSGRCATTRGRGRSSWRSPEGRRMRRRAHVIVGGGMAGAKTAEALRGEGFDRPVVLIGDEPEAPYERPPLSKDFLRGELPKEDTRVHPEAWYREHEV